MNMVDEYMKNKEVRETKNTWKWKRLNTATLHINREYIHTYIYIYYLHFVANLCKTKGDSVERDDMYASLK